MSTLSDQLRTELTEAGASLVGFADLRDLPSNQREGFDYGIAIAVAIDPVIVNGIGNGPTTEYWYETYKRAYGLVDSLDIKAAEILKNEGYSALPKTRANVTVNYNDRSTLLPYKTVATRAGLGWIGKCALLVTEKYGSAVRISYVLADAPLEVAKPINESRCGDCSECAANCPAEAVTGSQWTAGIKRKVIYNATACRNKAVERSWNVSLGLSACGLCILVCPWTKKYILSLGLKYGFPSVDIAGSADLEEILALQKLAYQENARRYNDFGITPLTQTIEDLRMESKSNIILKVVQDRRIVGSVRGYEKEGTCYIGRLIVHPDYQNKGVGKKLMNGVEDCFRGVRYELFTGHMDEKNLAFYEKLGYTRFKTERVNDNLSMIYLEKNPHPPAPSPTKLVEGEN